MRLFLAIDLPTQIKQKLDRQLSKIKKTYPDFNWVSTENYHITIYFFGQTEKVMEIKKRLNDLIFDQEAFYLYSKNIGLFINSKIIIYLDFRREKKLEKLGDKIRDNFGASADREKKFIPHLTLARCRRPSKQQYFVLKKKMEKVPVDISFPVHKFTLFESVLGGKKPVYKKITEFPLL